MFSAISRASRDALRAGRRVPGVYDDAHSDDEDRFIAIGPILRGVIVVVYTERADDIVRIIGARFATRRQEKKTRQLCREVERTLACALGECADELLRDLIVIAVEPAPDAGRLSVRFGASSVADAALVLERLEKLKGHLRAEVARAVVRKRAPELAFEVVLDEVQP